MSPESPHILPRPPSSSTTRPPPLAWLTDITPFLRSSTSRIDLALFRIDPNPFWPIDLSCVPDFDADELAGCDDSKITRCGGVGRDGKSMEVVRKRSMANKDAEVILWPAMPEFDHTEMIAGRVVGEQREEEEDDEQEKEGAGREGEMLQIGMENYGKTREARGQRCAGARGERLPPPWEDASGGERTMGRDDSGVGRERKESELVVEGIVISADAMRMA
ncbi:hypothetical protein EX30DRAFT_373335 [Ascodesmis nigricans]|uniref:Uncharacterized protein n=1 Tax=Ascodesmis nigricans TaxID=341454 RepID=A0A4S2MP80_9PEZI|nr:hypothetical protein EX30DRAFT_373335 [Ascodesmis nigricans]